MRKFNIVLPIISIFLVTAELCNAQGIDALYPPLINGRPDFSGVRFGVQNEKGRFQGKRPSVMKRGFIVRYEIPPGHHSLPPDINLYLAKDRPAEAEIEEDEKDTMIRYVRTLDDLKGFVKIRTETDALEFLRFGSCAYHMYKFSTQIEEIYCISDTSILPSRKDHESVFWATVDQCRRFNLTPVRILNPLTPKERRELEDDESDDDREEGKKSRRRGGSKRFFLIERTVDPGNGSPLLNPRRNPNPYRIVEEVGPEGQWRIVSAQEIPIPAVEYKKLIRQSSLLELFPE